MSFRSRMPLSLEMTMTRSPACMAVEPSGMMISCSRTSTAMRMLGLSRRSFRATPRFRVLGLTVNSMASAPPSAMR